MKKLRYYITAEKRLGHTWNNIKMDLKIGLGTL
jgi:hypothetical protein